MASEPLAMRDAFIERLSELAKQDRNIVFVSADMGAPALDRFRRDLSGQYVNTGVAEQNMIMVASGLAMSGKKAFTFSIAPFATARCFEFTKINISLMNLPVTIIGVGAGFSYDGDGPTHYSTEDVSIMRVLPHMEILSPCDSIAAAGCADLAYKADHPVYIRLDRQVVPDIYDPSYSFEDGFRQIKPGTDICIAATANMVHNALSISSRCGMAGKEIGVIDLYRLKPLGDALFEAFSKFKTVISLEEHLLNGGMGSALAEEFIDRRLQVALKRFGINDKYVYAYGRKYIQKLCGIDEDSVIESIERM